MDTLPVSVCMIVRDEADVLPIALASVVEWAAQVVVVDTGSRDASLDVARRFGADVASIEWTNDFAAARNASMDLATAPWTLILDADEWVDPQDLTLLSELVSGTGRRAYRFPQRNYVDSTRWAGVTIGPMPPVWGLTAVGWVVARQMRLVPTDPRVRYEGAVHETLVPSLEAAGVECADAEFPVHHVGKLRSAAVMARKKRLYRELGEIKLATEPSGMALMELGIQCSELGEHEEARRLLAEAAAVLPHGPERARGLACLASQVEMLEGTDAAVQLLRHELPHEAVHPDLWERLGMIFVRCGQYARAAEVLERALRSFPEGSNLLRLAAEAELAVRQWSRAEELYDRLQRAGEGTGMGIAGRAVARAGQGRPEDLLECLRGTDPAVARSAQMGAQRWLPVDWVFATSPGAWTSVEPGRAHEFWARGYAARGRVAARRS